MADLDIAEHRRGQDGRIDFSRFGGIKLELRVAVLPTSNGLEDVVMRLLGTSELMPFEKLGLHESIGSKLAELVRRPHGMILLCGPTGSGKTSTLHSLLAKINQSNRKIWTAEDPVEISQPGLRQVQVNARIGWTFAAAIRMFLRADPDVIMVGEMRDAETAQAGIEAALTGHLVLSTLHTNSAAEAVVRLIDLGMDPFNFADSLLGVLGQRLARRLCPQCRKRRPTGDEEMASLAHEYCADTGMKAAQVLSSWSGRFGKTVHLSEAAGCDGCLGSGYAGRIGIHELLVADSDIRRLIHHRASAAEIQNKAVRRGMLTMRQDGIEKALSGHTDLHEVRASTA
jgi:type II secretory ATPase GspE/PulE/Tfp pilus assembly ATPase PilB-like protein